MAGRRGRSTSRRGQPTDPATYYVSSDSDVQYAKQTRQRLKHAAIRKWILGLAFIAVVSFVVWKWGPDLLAMARVQTHMTKQEIQDAGGHIRDGVERRSGTEFIEPEAR